MPATSERTAYYALAVFASSAVLLVLEIVAGRLIAPYVGSSLYTWTSIIGVILAGLSLGNWVGGVVADRGAGPRAAAWALALSGLAALAILGLLTLIAPSLQASSLGLLGASFLYVATLFFMPALCLGVVTPLLTTLALRGNPRPGHVVGRMHALAALGSIVGTFVTGYWLVQYIGTRAIIVGCGALLIALALPLFGRLRDPRVLATLVLALVLVALAQWRGGLATPCDHESNYFCIRVVDEPDAAPWGEARTLVLDHLAHGINHLQDPRLLIAPYVQLIDELLGDRFGDRKGLGLFFAGGGSYTLPRALRAADATARVVVAEIDPRVTAVAAERLYVATDAFEVAHVDARVALARHPPGAFDAVVSDVFHDLSVPYHLLTREYFALVRSRLGDGGMLLLNVVDLWPEPRLVASVLRTLDEEFAHSAAWLESPVEEGVRQTYVVAASDRPLPRGGLRARRGLPRYWSEVGTQLETGGDSVVLTDDLVPVERLLTPLLVGDAGR